MNLSQASLAIGGGGSASGPGLETSHLELALRVFACAPVWGYTCSWNLRKPHTRPWPGDAQGPEYVQWEWKSREAMVQLYKDKKLRGSNLMVGLAPELAMEEGLPAPFSFCRTLGYLMELAKASPDCYVPVTAEDLARGFPSPAWCPPLPGLQQAEDGGDAAMEEHKAVTKVLRCASYWCYLYNHEIQRARKSPPKTQREMLDIYRAGTLPMWTPVIPLEEDVARFNALPPCLFMTLESLCSLVRAGYALRPVGIQELSRFDRFIDIRAPCGSTHTTYLPVNASAAATPRVTGSAASSVVGMPTSRAMGLPSRLSSLSQASSSRASMAGSMGAGSHQGPPPMPPAQYMHNPYAAAYYPQGLYTPLPSPQATGQGSLWPFGPGLPPQLHVHLAASGAFSSKPSTAPSSPATRLSTDGGRSSVSNWGSANQAHNTSNAATSTTSIVATGPSYPADGSRQAAASPAVAGLPQLHAFLSSSTTSSTGGPGASVHEDSDAAIAPEAGHIQASEPAPEPGISLAPVQLPLLHVHVRPPPPPQPAPPAPPPPSGPVPIRWQTALFRLFCADTSRGSFEPTWWYMDPPGHPHGRVVGPISCEQMILGYAQGSLNDMHFVCGTTSDVPAAMPPAASNFEPIGNLLQKVDQGGHYVLVSLQEVIDALIQHRAPAAAAAPTQPPPAPQPPHYGDGGGDRSHGSSSGGGRGPPGPGAPGAGTPGSGSGGGAGPGAPAPGPVQGGAATGTASWGSTSPTGEGGVPGVGGGVTPQAPSPEPTPCHVSAEPSAEHLLLPLPPGGEPVGPPSLVGERLPPVGSSRVPSRAPSPAIQSPVLQSPRRLTAQALMGMEAITASTARVGGLTTRISSPPDSYPSELAPALQQQKQQLQQAKRVEAGQRLMQQMQEAQEASMGRATLGIAASMPEQQARPSVLIQALALSARGQGAQESLLVSASSPHLEEAGLQQPRDQALKRTCAADQQQLGDDLRVSSLCDRLRGVGSATF